MRDLTDFTYTHVPSSVILNLCVRFSPSVFVPLVKIWKATLEQFKRLKLGMFYWLTSERSRCMLVMNLSRNVAVSTWSIMFQPDGGYLELCRDGRHGMTYSWWTALILRVREKKEGKVYFSSLISIALRVQPSYQLPPPGYPIITFSPIRWTSVWYCRSSFKVVEFCNIFNWTEVQYNQFWLWLATFKCGNLISRKPTWMIKAVMGRKGRSSMCTCEEKREWKVRYWQANLEKPTNQAQNSPCPKPTHHVQALAGFCHRVDLEQSSKNFLLHVWVGKVIGTIGKKLPLEHQSLKMKILIFRLLWVLVS